MKSNEILLEMQPEEVKNAIKFASSTKHMMGDFDDAQIYANVLSERLCRISIPAKTYGDTVVFDLDETTFVTYLEPLKEATPRITFFQVAQAKKKAFAQALTERVDEKLWWQPTDKTPPKFIRPVPEQWQEG